jgi:hypothetical protein
MRASILGLICGGGLLAGLAAAMPHDPKPAAGDFDSQKALDDLRKAIAGKENQPSEQVFKNVQMFKGVPAGDLLGAMNSFNQALGVSCKKCHDVSNWASDDKKNKGVARGMMTLTGDVNKQLQTIQGMNKDAFVNCGMCHRGHSHPQDGMTPAAEKGH